MSAQTAFAAAALLPAGLIDVLPPRAAFEAAAVERLVAAFAGFGYERVKPPLIEFEETLLAGSGNALAGQTFRMMDPAAQRMLAVRPDITMQVARIAATRLAFRPRPLRLSYAGQVLRVRGTQLRPERQLGQVGAELLGADVAAADVEIIVMAVTALSRLGLAGLSVDLGLPTLIPRLMGDERLDPDAEQRLRLALDRKDAAGVLALAPEMGDGIARMLAHLVTSAGPVETALAALAALPLPAAAAAEFAKLAAVAGELTAAMPELMLTIDTVESRGFEYHTGVTFSLFAAAASGELGRGGHYRTESGEAATGVTLLMDAVLAGLAPPAPPARLLLPAGTPATAAAALRDDGWVTIAALAPVADPAAEARRLGCSHVLQDGRIEAVTTTDQQ